MINIGRIKILLIFLLIPFPVSTAFSQFLCLEAYIAGKASNPATYPELYYEIKIAELNTKTTLELFYDNTVQEYIDAFLSHRKDQYLDFRKRSDFFFPLFEKYFNFYGIPEELKYVAVVESGLQPEACSPSMAMGLWQFKKRTGMHFGLEISAYYDERLDPELSTIAACQYLVRLYERFDSWELSLLAYNTGPTALRQAIRDNDGKTEYSSLVHHLSHSTQRYLPAIVAILYLFENYENHFLIE
jgi:membrane-bound lytic murein transglycosylase D